jgi:hypothetical protein
MVYTDPAQEFPQESGDQTCNAPSRMYRRFPFTRLAPFSPFSLRSHLARPLVSHVSQRAKRHARGVKCWRADGRSKKRFLGELLKPCLLDIWQPLAYTIILHIC